MMILYHILGTFVFAAALPVLPLVWVLSEKRRANLLQRLGLFTGFRAKENAGSRIWVHALSVGEVNSALPLIQGLAAERSDAEIVFTASTRTGFQTACNLFMPDKGPRLVSQIGYFPFDLWFSVRRVVSKIDPDLVILVETDLWPGVISIVSGRGIPLVLVNARLSTAALRGYRRFGFLARPMLKGLSRVMAQTGTDARRFREAGVGEERILVAGNIKFDRSPLEMDERQIQGIRSDLGLKPGQQAWIAGSTHPGEEEKVIKAFDRARVLVPDLKLVIAPRDPDRSPGLAGDLGGGEYKTARLSDGPERKEAADILLIDCLGVLVQAYAAASLAFVGGSLVAQGGHNPLEPAMFGKPVLFGPHMEDFQEVAEMLVTAGGAEQTDTEGGLAAAVEKILDDPGGMEKMGRAAEAVFFSNSGAVARTIETMEALGFV